VLQKIISVVQASALRVMVL